MKHLSESIAKPVVSDLFGPYESSFRTVDATDHQPIGNFFLQLTLSTAELTFVSLQIVHLSPTLNELKPARFSYSTELKQWRGWLAY